MAYNKDLLNDNKHKNHNAYFCTMKELIAYILQFGNLNQKQIELIGSKAKEVTLHKDDYFSEAGEIARQVGFILDGVIRICYYNNKGEEVTRYFIDDNNFIVDLNSYANQVPASEYYQAVTETKMLVFSQTDWDELYQTIVGWESIISKITSKALLQKVDRVSPLIAEDATTRYLSFFEKFPNLANRIPLIYLASYLGITKSSLSRIRKNIC